MRPGRQSLADLLSSQVVRLGEPEDKVWPICYEVRWCDCETRKTKSGRYAMKSGGATVRPGRQSLADML